MRQQIRAAFILLLLHITSACTHTPIVKKYSDPFIVSSADYRATDAGIAILKQGGSAIDAAIAVQSVLSLVEPQSSGVGGGAFMLYYDAENQKIKSFDGREKAPASMQADAFMDQNGQAKHYFDVAFGGQAVGVPGVMALLDKAHQQHGILPWNLLFKSAENLAKDGFKVSPRLSNWLQRFPKHGAHPAMLNYFYDADGKARPAGYLLKNPQYANTMQLTAQLGAKTFYTGEIAKQIVQAINHAPIAPRNMTLDDLANYQAIARQPICAPYRSYKVCSMAPPTSGGVFLLQTLGMLQHFDLKKQSPFSAQAIHLIIEASRIAYADRQQYIADPAFVDIPLQGLLSPDYLKQRATLINPKQAAKQYGSGAPEPFNSPNKQAMNLSPHQGKDTPSTSHFSIMDAEGNVVSMTTTVQGPFGSFLPAAGFILNNQLTDFSYIPMDKGIVVANAAAPNKRPRSSMTPTIIFDQDDQVYMVIGSPGGGRIFSYVLKTVLAALDWEMDMQAAIDAPNITLPNGHLELEQNRFQQSTINQLQAMGHIIKQNKQESGLNGFIVTKNGFDGGADKRREGTFRIETR